MRELRYVLFLTCATVASCADNGSETTSQDEISNVELVLVQEECRQGGEVEAFGETWLLAEAAPNEWRDDFPVAGVVGSRNGPTAVFEANSVQLSLIQRGGGVGKDDGCTLWQDDELDGDAVEADLVLVQEECRQGGEVEAFGETWLLAEPAPEEWYGQFPIPGIVSPGNGPTAVFVARGADLELIEKSVGSESEPPCTEWANANLVGEG